MKRSTRLIHERKKARAMLVQSGISKQVDAAFDKFTARRLGDLMILYMDGKTRYTFTEIKQLIGEVRAATLSADLRSLEQAGFIRIKRPSSKMYVGKQNVYYVRRARIASVFSSIYEVISGERMLNYGDGRDAIDTDRSVGSDDDNSPRR